MEEERREINTFFYILYFYFIDQRNGNVEKDLLLCCTADIAYSATPYHTLPIHPPPIILFLVHEQFLRSSESQPASQFVFQLERNSNQCYERYRLIVHPYRTVVAEYPVLWVEALLVVM